MKNAFLRTSTVIILTMCLASCQKSDNSAAETSDEKPFTSYFTGNPEDKKVSPNYGITMMGGRSEHDQAMTWFLEQANGGDILVLRASGSDGYNNYLFSGLGVAVNSVESLVIKTPEAANHPYVHEKIKNAEAIWMAGGNQFNYVGIWGDSPMKQLLNDHINVKRGVIGGTSAGMAVLGEWYFSAENGSIKSEEALANPFHEKAQVGNDFLKIPILENTITDTHYANRNRQGRHSAFISRVASEENEQSFGIACDEYTAVCVGEDGIAHIYGKSPAKEEAVYFIQTTCEGYKPEIMEANQPLTWNNGGKALSVYKVVTDSTGTSTFDLNNWKTGNGGKWLNWYVENGKWFEVKGTQPNCN